MSTAYTTVPAGYYFGFTREELDAELARYKAAVKTAKDRELTSGSINGKSMSWGYRGNLSLEAWSAELQQAYNLLDPDNTMPVPDRTVAVVR